MKIGKEKYEDQIKLFPPILHGHEAASYFTLCPPCIEFFL